MSGRLAPRSAVATLRLPPAAATLRLPPAAATLCALTLTACGSSAATHANDSPGRGQFVAYSDCMRTHGVPGFPDPGPQGGLQLPAGIDTSSPSFENAQAACADLLPGGGPGKQHASEQAKLQLLRISKCMRARGIGHFPDPVVAPPTPPPPDGGIVIGRGGVALIVPASAGVATPAFRQAAATCRFGAGPGVRSAVPNA